MARTRGAPLSQSKALRYMSVEELARCLPDAASHPNSICILLEAARVPNRGVVGLACKALAEILQFCPWLPLHVGLPTADRLVPALRAIGTVLDDPNGSPLAFRRLAPEFRVLTDGKFVDGPELKNLVGIWLLVRLSIGSKVGTSLTKTGLQDFEAAIVGHREQPTRRMHWDLVSLFSEKLTLERLAQLSVQLHSAPNSRASRNHKIEIFCAQWLREFLAFRVDQLRARIGRRYQDLLIKRPWVDAIDLQDGEPPDALPSPLPPSVDEQGVPVSDAYQAALAYQSTRTRNYQFQPAHAEVLLDGQAEAVIQRGLRALAKRSQKIATTGRWGLTLLTAATGRMPSALSEMTLAEGLPSAGRTLLHLDLLSGVLHATVVAPPNIATPDPDDARFERPAGTMRLPLPLALVDGIRTAWKTHPVGRLGDWLQGVDPERAIRECLRETSEVAFHTREPAALRKWMTCRFFAERLDKVALQIACNDTFGESDAALYYYSPRECDLIAQHLKAIHPAFQMGAPVREVQASDAHFQGDERRVGPAFLVKEVVIRAGINELTGQLNVNKISQANALKSLVRYHNLFADYWSRRFAFTTTHRPNESLYAVTRDQLSLLRHHAILQDKLVDPEHFTRLVCTTAAFSELTTNYLLHLRYLAQHALASAAARTYLNDVIEGRQPLIVYLDESKGSYEARPGMLADWGRSSPPAWDGLRPNIHRAFMMNALREAGAEPGATLACEILTQSGHLDTAGHPYADDAVVAPCEQLFGVRERLEKLERRLGFRQIRGFADLLADDPSKPHSAEVMTPPRLGYWTKDLADHKSARADLLKEERARMDSTLTNVQCRAEAWLEKHLPELSPQLAAVLNATLKSDHKKVPSELFDVVISDLEILEVVERIGELSSGENQALFPLQIATHNLLSQRLRLAQKRLKLRCRRIGVYRLTASRGLSPFLARNLVAVDQIQKLRQHLEQIIHQPGIPEWQLAAWALALYDPQLSPEQIFAIATGRSHLKAHPKLLGAVLVSDANRGAAITLVGLAALVASRSAPEVLRRSAHGIDTVQELGRRLRSSCPDELRPLREDDFLEVLLQTVDVAARIEEPGLLRLSGRGVPARECRVEDLAAFHADAFPPPLTPIAEVARSWSIDPLHQEAQPVIHVRKNLSEALARSYHRLTYALSDPIGYVSGHSRSSPDSGITSVRASKIEIQDALLKAFPVLKNDDLVQSLDVVTALASFTLALNERSRRGRGSLRKSSLSTYLTSIGQRLVEVFGTTDLMLLGEEEFEESYRLIVDSLSRIRTGRRARRVLREFHNYLVRRYHLTEADISFVAVTDAHKKDRTLPRLLTKAHYLAALRWIEAQLDRPDLAAVEYTQWRRALLTAGTQLVVIWNGGLRIAECVWSRHRDLLCVAGQWYVLVRPNKYRELKTAAAKRLVWLDLDHDAAGATWLTRWYSATTRRGGGDDEGAHLLFPHLQCPDRSLGEGTVRTLIQCAFSHGAGVDMDPHDLRHAFATRRWAKAISEPADWSRPLELSRRLDALRIQLGHASLTTTAEYYIHHLQLLKLQRAYSTLGFGNTRNLVASLAISGLGTLDKAWQRRSKDRQLCWDPESERIRMAVERLGSVEAINVRKRPGRMLPAVVSCDQPVWRGYELVDEWIRGASTREELDKAGHFLGFSNEVIGKAAVVIERLAAAPMCYRLIAGTTRKGRTAIQRRPRVFDEQLAQLPGAPSPKIVGDAAERLIVEIIRPAQLRQGCLRWPQDQKLAARFGQTLNGWMGSNVRLVQSGDFMEVVESEGSRVLTHQTTWSVAIAAVTAGMAT